MAKSRSSKRELLPPNEDGDESIRKQWLKTASDGFVAPGDSNRRIYSLLLTTFWPAGHGLPGPHIARDELRRVIDEERRSSGEEPYRDPFRRLRELQGEEGYVGIIKSGNTYQLQSTAVAYKRTPRETLPESEWQKIKAEYSGKCAMCGLDESKAPLSPDHRVPRLRGGDNSLANYQPLCEQCNNIKSSMCSNCEQNCQKCPWAFPETHRPLKLDDEAAELLRKAAKAQGDDQSAVASSIIKKALTSGRRPK